MKKKKGFTLVELLAVIVILAVILVITVPKIISTITDSRKGTLISSAKLIAASAESAYMSNQTLGMEKPITCKDVSKLNSEDYESCTITFDENGKAKVTLVGKGKFEGMSVCGATKESAVVVESCITTGPSDDVEKKGDLNEYTWEEIQKIASDTNLDEEGLAEFGIQVGDTKIYNDITYYLVDDNRGIANTYGGFVFMFLDTTTMTAKRMNSTPDNTGGYSNAEVRTYVESLFPDLQLYMKQVKVYCNTSDGSIQPTVVSGIKLFVPAVVEVGLIAEVSGSDLSYKEEGNVFDWFSGEDANSNRIKASGVIIDEMWWSTDWYLRSVDVDTNSNFMNVSSSGFLQSAAADRTIPLMIAFVIG